MFKKHFNLDLYNKFIMFEKKIIHFKYICMFHVLSIIIFKINISDMRYILYWYRISALLIVDKICFHM